LIANADDKIADEAGQQMKTNFTARAGTLIGAPVTLVWKALIDPEIIKEYLFGRTVISDWKVGSQILYRGECIRDQGLQVELEPTLAKTRTLSERAYLHIDLDVLDLGEARINEFSVAGGLRLTELLAVVGLVRKHFVLGAAAITAYDPAYDQDGRGVRAAEAVFRELTKN
jgi:hypothetical protein